MDASILEKPFEQEDIKTRPGPNRKPLTYVEGCKYKERLIIETDNTFSFDVEDYEMVNGCVIVKGKLTIDGSSITLFGSKKIENKDKEGHPLDLGNDIKAAQTDCLKVASSYKGLGLHLYNDDAEEAPASMNKSKSGMSQMTPNKGNGRITKQQLSQIKSLRTKLGWTGEQAIGLVQQLYNTDNPLDLNSEQAKNVIAVLAKKLNEQNQNAEPEEII
jgi:hypothetical protein